MGNRAIPPRFSAHRRYLRVQAWRRSTARKRRTFPKYGRQLPSVELRVRAGQTVHVFAAEEIREITKTALHGAEIVHQLMCAPGDEGSIDYTELRQKEARTACHVEPGAPRPSRFFAEFREPVGNGSDNTVKGYFEFDFLGGYDRKSFRLRQFYGQYKNFLVGQTWSSFGDPDVFPDTPSSA
jgi:hypothetical protein